MKKFATTLLALAAIGAFASQASAASLMFDGFAYPDGDLTTGSAGLWTTHSGTPPVDVQVVSGRAVTNMANAPDDNRAFTAQPLTSSTYACFDVIVPDPGASPKAVYFAHFKDTGTTNFNSRVYVLPVAGGNGFTFGLSYSSTSAATVGAVPWSVGSLTYGQLYRIVIKYDPVALTSIMWVDPVDETSTSISQSGTGATAISGFALRQSSTAAAQPATAVPSGPANFIASVDNVGVGITFDDACSGPPTSNRSGTWGQVKVMYR
jgi:hypothetical protein